MKNIFAGLFILLASSIRNTLCQDIIVPTDYTRSYLINLIEKKPCSENRDCPAFSYCETEFQSKGYCAYLQFLCPNDLNAPCHFVNHTIWNDITDKIDPIYANLNPIMKTCTTTQIDAKTCKTKRCQEDQECYSGQCYRNYCATTLSMYMCSKTDSEERYRLGCKKRNHMPCDSGDECASDICKNGYCQKINSNKFEWIDLVWLAMGLVLMVGVMYVVLNALNYVGLILDPKQMKKYL